MEETELIVIPYIKIFSDELEALEPFSDVEVGRLFRGMLRYMNGLDPALDGNERFAWGMVKNQLNAQKQAYIKKVESVTNARTAKIDFKLKSNQSEISMKSESNQSEISMKSEQEKRREEKKREENNKEKNKESNKKEKEPKKSFGEFGWIKLSDSDYTGLIQEYGDEEVTRSIKYIDELAESTGNARKWKNWRLVISRSCRDGWGKGGIFNKVNRPAAKKDYTNKPEGWIDL